jgi:hypothetical protein
MASLFCQVGFLYACAEATLDALEQQLFSTTYPQENRTQRLDRLDQRVFGDVQAGTDSSRSARLQGVLKNLLTPNAQTAPSLNGRQSPSDLWGGNQPPSLGDSEAVAPVIPDATDYPTVTALERQVFGRDFIREDIQVRLNRLEKKVFGQANPNRALADRVDSLLSRYPNVMATASSAPDVINVRPSPVSPTLQSLPDDPAQFTSNQRDIYSKLNALEQHHFNGQSTPNALITERLDRLELKAYGKTFNGQSVDNRVARLLNPYQSNRNANRNTPSSQSSLSRPGFQPRPGYQSASSTWQSSNTNSTSSAPPQNIQIGGGFSSNSSYSFSPEMMSMLPPQVRSQLAGSNASSMTNTGTVIGSPGTVVIERQSMGNAGVASGFQTYGNAPIQNYNYYSSPNGTVTQSQSTTVIQPYGGQTTLETTTSGYPAPYYVGDPAFLQSLNQLEINVFKQVNTVEPVPVRIGRLEASLLGQMYPALPEQQRLANLEKTYRLQAVSKLLGQSKGANVGRGVGSLFLGVPLNGPNPINPMGMPQPLPVNPGVFGR